MKNKRLRTALLIAGIAVVVEVTALVLLNVLLPKEESKTEQNTAKTIKFYAVYDGDVRENEVYLGLDRQFYLCDDNYGTKEAIDENQFAGDAKLALIRDYINALIDGYPDACRQLMTEKALSETPIPDFAQQMIYRIEITETESSGNETVYCLEYLIYRNNGMYRADVGSNASKPEYLTVVETSDGEYRIDGIHR